MNRILGNLLCCALMLSFASTEVVGASSSLRHEPARFEDYHGQPVSPGLEQNPVPYADSVLPSMVSVTPENSDQLTINLANKTEIEKQYIQAFYLRGERDGDILLKTIDDLRRSLRDLTVVVSDLQKVSDESILQPVPVRDFLDTARTFRQESNLFLEDVNSLEHFPTLRPDITADSESRVDMLPLIRQYQSYLRNLDTRVSKLYFTIALPSGVLHQQLGISSDQLKSMSLYTADQIADMKRNIMQLRAMRTQDKRVIDEGINRFTKDAIETFIDTFGTSERYRTVSDTEGNKRAQEMLIDAFWARSYIRSTYGIQIGCIPVEYDKRIFNLDYYLSDMTVGAAPVYDQNKLMRYSNLAREAQVTIENSASKRWLSVSSWLTWVAGKSNEMDTKYFILALIKKDIDEELAISRSGGLRKVRDGYRQHYLSSDMGRALYQAKANQVFSSSEDDDDIERDVMVVEAGTLRGAVALCINALENQENRLDEARKLQSVVDMLTRGNVVSDRRKRRQLF
ncbi:hypothetical protein [Endozoicomonas sp. ONNA2]|uniref:hypothetical protein n=1 Tax=Endozoicomonas sp. ONNA2 TaxID=2828741 RepID=UPI0021475AD6|nr:hypothetical protein [Endozoicomonas sp. ONNA2]